MQELKYYYKQLCSCERAVLQAGIRRMHIEPAKEHCRPEGVELLPPVCKHWKLWGIDAGVDVLIYKSKTQN